MSLRILHVTPYAPAAWAYGGIPRIVGALAREQVRRGHHVTICATDAATETTRATPGLKTRRSSLTARRSFESRVDTRIFPNLSNRLAYSAQLFLPIGMSRYLADHAHEFDVAHLHGCRNLPGVLAARHLRRAGVPYVLAPNGTAPRLERRFLAKRVFDLVAGQSVLDHAAAILAVSDAERHQLAALRIAPSRIQRVPNPIDLDEFNTPGPRGLFRGRYALGDAPVVLFLGKLTPRKRVDALVRAFARLDHPGAKLVIAGNDMGSGHALRALVRQLGLDARTVFTGLLSGSDRLDALGDADVVVYPSADEIFGLVPLEAILCGTPVVVADDSGCGEVIETVGGGFVTPLGDIGRLADAIARVLDDGEAWRARVATAAARVRTRFSPATVCDALDDVYASMASSARSSSTAPTSIEGVSFVVPVRNGAPWLRATLDAIWREDDGRPFEIVVVDDGSEDNSTAIALASANGRALRVVRGDGRGAAAALNIGFRAARFPIVCQVDQDVTIRPGWMTKLVNALADPRVAAAQGRYVFDATAPMASRIMAMDLEQRYAGIHGSATDHVCTGNTAYRADAVHAVGLFDETLGYGYDNDLSYRLRQTDRRLLLVRDATSVHHWRDSFAAYLRQQYGFGYGRLDVVAKHPSRATGDVVSPLVMMLHPIALAVAVALFVGSIVLRAAGTGPAIETTAVAALILIWLVAERTIAGLFAWRRFKDPSALLFPFWHLARDAAWVWAVGLWTTRAVFVGEPAPENSMMPRPAGAKRHSSGRAVIALGPDPVAPTRVLGLIPAHNEGASLEAVIAEIRSHHPALDVLVIDDGSTDGTSWLLEDHGVPYLRLPERMGVGSAMRAGLGYAARQGYDGAIRLDGDGQHHPEDVDAMLAPLLSATADVVLGSRYASGFPAGRPIVGAIQRVLASCVSIVAGTVVTDPTSGFYAIGPRAIRLLAEHHPTGYAEPELRLFLSHNGLVAVEVPVQSRPRLVGQSSLTPARLLTAAARVMLALITVRFRRAVSTSERD